LADELVIQGDPWLIELALSNLIQNAIDFAPKGSAIVIRCYRFDSKAVIEIEDRGPGIPDYARERVFERFYSLPRPDTGKKSTGSGPVLRQRSRATARRQRGTLERRGRTRGEGDADSADVIERPAKLAFFLLWHEV
jgi:two-component system sensor histidine kinase CreC